MSSMVTAKFGSFIVWSATFSIKYTETSFVVFGYIKGQLKVFFLAKYERRKEAL